MIRCAVSSTAPAQVSASGSTAGLPPRKDTGRQPRHREKVQEGGEGGEAKGRGIPKIPKCKQQPPFPAQLSSAAPRGASPRYLWGRRRARPPQTCPWCAGSAERRGQGRAAEEAGAVSSAGAAALLSASLCSRSRAQDVRNGGRRGGGTRGGTATAGALGSGNHGTKGSFRSEKTSKIIELTAEPTTKPRSEVTHPHPFLTHPGMATSPLPRGNIFQCLTILLRKKFPLISNPTLS